MQIQCVYPKPHIKNIALPTCKICSEGHIRNGALLLRPVCYVVPYTVLEELRNKQHKVAVTEKLWTDQYSATLLNKSVNSALHLA